jgi:hypothetical protein
MVAVGGIFFGSEWLATSPHADEFDRPGRVGFEEACENWDGKWYVRIAQHGYEGTERPTAAVAFFPAYPLVGRAVASVSGLSHRVGLVLASHLFLLGSAFLLMDYVRLRRMGAPPDVADYAALALLLTPLSFFFRVAYTESMFMFVGLLAAYGVVRRWPVLVIAIIVGVATATRPVGVALLPLVVAAVCRRNSSWVGRAVGLSWAVPLSCWGLIAYAAYLGVAFGDPLAFSSAQDHWRYRTEIPFGQKILAIVTFEPLWSVYDPSGPAYWGRFDWSLVPPFSLMAANPVYFVAAVGLVAVGRWQRWLSVEEFAVALGLLLIPYASRGYYSCMLGQGRYAMAVFPVYLVLGQILARLPPPVAAASLTLSGTMMAVNAALFASRYFLI